MSVFVEYSEGDNDIDWSDAAIEERQRNVVNAVFARDAELNPVHPLSQAALDPDQMIEALGVDDAEQRGEPINPDEYSIGTWFLYGTDIVAVAQNGKIIRTEVRQ